MPPKGLGALPQPRAISVIADVAFGSKCLSEFPLAEVVQDESFAEEISIFSDKDVEK